MNSLIFVFRGNDSFNSFDELLQIGRDKEVDMVLLGGDLFHDNKVSVPTYRTDLGDPGPTLQLI